MDKIDLIKIVILIVLVLFYLIYKFKNIKLKVKLTKIEYKQLRKIIKKKKLPRIIFITTTIIAAILAVIAIALKIAFYIATDIIGYARIADPASIIIIMIIDYIKKIKHLDLIAYVISYMYLIRLIYINYSINKSLKK